ncbi:hypothetical protein SAMN05216320_1011394 [Duganella sp. OV458]|nr:hypothetical protein SAMN05216320_1011394 [Duganella sp. OV458]SDI48321.1 hypothetical protein SAMN05428973_10121 [Duganella sp. OV510]
MAKFRKKPVVIDAITFDELMQHGRENTAHVGDTSLPGDFVYQGCQVVRENDASYIVLTLSGNHTITPGVVLVTGVAGELYPCKADIFGQTHEPA